MAEEATDKRRRSKRKKVAALAETIFESPDNPAVPYERGKLGTDHQDGIRFKTISFLSKMLDAKNSPVDLQEIAYQFHAQIGGAQGYVEMILTEYAQTSPGSLARTRVLQLMAKLFELGSPKERVGETALLSDDDLTAAYFGQLRRSGMKVVDDVWVDHVCI